MKAVITLPTSRPLRIQVAAWLAAAMLTVMAFAQLFEYEEFASTLMVLLPINDQPLISILAAVLVIAEVFSLPFLIAMRVSPLMWAVSGVCAAAVSLFWLFMMLTNAHSANSALFGSTIVLPGGLGAALWAMLMTGFVGYAVLWVMRSRYNS